jgi:hypothetical protein
MGAPTADVETVMQWICETAGGAMRRYAEVSNMDPGFDMPEYFLGATVFEKLGDRVTMTLETSIKKLRKWNDDANAHHSRVQSSTPEPEEDDPREYRVDLVAYDGDSQKKDEQGFLVLVEFKRDALKQGERDRLMSILDEIDTCPYGAIGSFLSNEPGSDRVAQEEKKALAAGDRWFKYDVAGLPPDTGHFAVCARLFPRRAN